MKKIIKIILIIAIPVALFALFLFLYKGTLVVNLKTRALIKVDGQNFENTDKLSVKLLAGKHKVQVKKEFYKDFEQSVRIGFLKKTELAPELELTPESKERREKSEKIARDFIINYTNYSYENINARAAPIQPFVTEALLEELKTGYISARVIESYKKNKYAVSTEIKKIEIAEEEKEAISYNLELLRKTTTINSNKEESAVYQLDLAKIDGQWKIYNITL